MSAKYSFEIEEVSKEDIDSLAIGSSHGGILTFTSERTLPALTDIPTTDGFYVLLNGIEDPYNFGYALIPICKVTESQRRPRQVVRRILPTEAGRS